MQLTPPQVNRFYGIWFPLLRFVNQKRKVIDETLLRTESLNPNDAAVVRNSLWSDDRLLEDFVCENPAALSDADLAVVKSWRFRVSGTFLVVKHLKKYSVLVSGESSGSEGPKVYGVVGLNCPLEDILFDLPCMIKATLIPFEGTITYDSLFTSYPIILGRNITGTLNRDYQRAKKRGTIIESLGRADLAIVR